jgi:hypothetical protein
MIARLVVTLHFKTKSLVENGFGKQNTGAKNVNYIFTKEIEVSSK